MGDDAKRIYPIKKETRKTRDYFGAITGMDEEKRKKEAKYQEHIKEYGVPIGLGKTANDGISARLTGITTLNPTELEKRDLASYIKGYYEYANIQLNLICLSGKIPEKTENIIESLKKPNEEINIEKLLYDIGMRDGKDKNIIFEALPKAIQENKYYIEGFEQGLHEEYKKGR